MTGTFWGLSLAQWKDGFYLVGSAIAILGAIWKAWTVVTGRSRVAIYTGSRWTSMSQESGPWKGPSGRYLQVFLAAKGRHSLKTCGVDILARCHTSSLNLVLGQAIRGDPKNLAVVAVTGARSGEAGFKQHYHARDAVDLPKGRLQEVRIPLVELVLIATRWQVNRAGDYTFATDEGAEVYVQVICRPEGLKDAKALFYVRPHHAKEDRPFGRVRWWNLVRRGRFHWWQSNRYLVRQAKRVADALDAGHVVGVKPHSRFRR